MLIGREKEVRKLQELYDGDSAEFVAIYGRRRVGKTYLVDETFYDRFAFRHAGLSPLEPVYHTKKKPGKLKEQLRHFHQSLLDQGLEACMAPESWLEAFYMLEKLLAAKEDPSRRQLIFLDEIQWMDTPKSGFMTGLEAFWNGWACHRHHIMLVVCGSSSSWILDKLINNHGGLYGRVTCEINLQPFSLHECEQLFAAKGVVMSRYDIVQAYMAVGGIPYYLNYFQKELSLPQNIQEIFFEANAPLKFEFDRLFSSLFSNAEVMKSIVRALNSKNRGLTRSELLVKTGMTDSGEVSRFLNALITGAFVIKYNSFGNGKKESFFKLVDPFCIYYLKFVEDQHGKKTNWINIADSQAVTSWKGLAFENVCFNHIRQIKASLGISGVSTSESLWSKRGTDEESGTQIDLIIERKDNVINMCEAKFYGDEFTVTRDYHFTLERRKRLLQEHIPKRATIHSTLITTFGLRRVDHFSDFISVITLEDLFA